MLNQLSLNKKIHLLILSNSIKQIHQKICLGQLSIVIQFYQICIKNSKYRLQSNLEILKNTKSINKFGRERKKLFEKKKEDID